MTDRKHHKVSGMATTDPDRPQSLSNPPITPKERQKIKTAILNNIRDGHHTWEIYTEAELKNLGLGYLNILRTKQ